MTTPCKNVTKFVPRTKGVPQSIDPRFLVESEVSFEWRIIKLLNVKSRRHLEFVCSASPPATETWLGLDWGRTSVDGVEEAEEAAESFAVSCN